MFEPLLLAVTLVACPTTIIVNESTEWTHIDEVSITGAKLHCASHYTNSKCLIKFTKKGEGNYTAVCGEPR